MSEFKAIGTTELSDTPYPCPYCGCDYHLTLYECIPHIETTFSKRYYLSCVNCKASSPITPFDYTEALEQWNRVAKAYWNSIEWDEYSDILNTLQIEPSEYIDALINDNDKSDKLIKQISDMFNSITQAYDARDMYDVASDGLDIINNYYKGIDE